MNSILFPQVNKTLVQSDTTLHQCQSGGECVTCWQFTEEELKVISATGKLWMRETKTEPSHYIRLSVYSPYRKSEPLIVDEQISDRVIIHQHENEEWIIVKVEPGVKTPWAECFREKVELMGDGMEARFRPVCEQYNIDPWLAIFFKRVK